MLHFINVHLPLEEEEALFEVKIENGVYTSIKKQETYKEEGAFVPLQANVLGIEKQIDLQGRVMVPSFVDMHMHLDKAYTLSFVQNKSGTLEEAVSNYKKALPMFTEEDIRQRMVKTALQALTNGTTTIRTHIDFDCTQAEDVVFQALHTALEVKQELKPYLDIQVVPLFVYVNPDDEEQMKMIHEAIELGIDAIGGCPHIVPDPVKEIDTLFALAKAYDLPLDLHVDEDDDPAVDTIVKIAEKTMETNHQGKVNVGHLCSLAAMDEQKATNIIQLVKKANIHVVTLPAANLYLQGRNDQRIVRRGVTRIQELQEANVLVATASDNIHDPFHPFGKADLIQIGLLTGYAAHMGTKENQVELLRMITHIPAEMVGLKRYGIKEGYEASFVLFNAQSVEGIWTEVPETRFVFTKHRWVSVKETHQRLADATLTALWHENQTLL
ncbi:amidohydrolase family protein [Metabacillus iocasae]|uniref:Cytosine deaminase n=1 Tax=Priestia iocasae TaxID=2291674 RepID=A0ABS2QSM2_9BACI|nr:amidohydrolase family protein [Metabacillus iocasae]MBM7702434.1 cytosine deaminase [Metabacillus iocasae]